MGLFYFCTEDGCNRKYMRGGRLLAHVKRYHGKEVKLPELKEFQSKSKNTVNKEERERKKTERLQKVKEEKSCLCEFSGWLRRLNGREGRVCEGFDWPMMLVSALRVGSNTLLFVKGG